MDCYYDLPRIAIAIAIEMVGRRGLGNSSVLNASVCKPRDVAGMIRQHFVKKHYAHAIQIQGKLMPSE